MSDHTYGFVGLGNMGAPMSSRLLQAGYKLMVFDTDPKAIERAKALGAQGCGSLKQLADSVDTIFLSLPTPEIVQKVTIGEGGLITGSKVKRVVDLSTIGPRAAQQVAAALRKTGIVYVDSPVSGGIGGAAKGTLAVMTSCPPEDFAATEDALKQLGPVFYMGEQAGMGQSMKLANNLLSVTAMAATSEVMAMGVKAGLEPRMMLDVINAGSGRNSATQDKFPKAVLPGTFDIGFAAELAYKDVRLCIDEAESLGIPMIVGAAVREMLVLTQAAYGENADFTDIARLLESWSKVEIRAQ